ncbi:MAG: hypothetical protein AAF483_20885 [Planctomycetota bacterium]
MSRSADYIVLIREGNKETYAEVWGNLYRELMWGPEDFEQWVRTGGSIEEEPGELSGLAIVNFDNHSLTWGTCNPLDMPKSQALLEKMIATSWADFTVRHVGVSRLHATARSSNASDGLIAWEQEDDDYSYRPKTIQEAAEYFMPGTVHMDGDAAHEDYDDDETPFSEDLPGAWIAIHDDHGDLLHRGLSELPLDLLSNREQPLNQLTQLPAVQVPEEEFVTEGLVIHAHEKRLFYWGTDFEDVGRRLQQCWEGWTVTSATSGYMRQCELCKLNGQPLSESKALAAFLQQVLSTKRMSIGNWLGAVGGSIKRTAIRATGCLTVILALPIVLSAIFMNKWKEAGFALATLVAIVVVAFKFVEFLLKSKFQASVLAAKDEDLESQRPPTAGSKDATDRKQKLGELLATCNLPCLAEIEPFYDEDLKDFL